MDVYQVITTHRTIRKYRETTIPPEDLEKIIYSAFRAPSSSNLQAYSIIRITDRNLRKQIAELAGKQEQIVTASEFFIFVADMYRLINCCKGIGVEAAQPNFLMLYVATVDAALAAQNMTLTAESLGYGTCYIGAIQEDPCGIAKLLNLPEYTYPLFGLTIGVPDEDPDLRPRLPKEAILHENRYPDDGSNIKAALNAFKGTEFHDSFRRRIKRYYSEAGRYKDRYSRMKNCLLSQGFNV